MRFEIDGPLEEPRTLVAVGVDPELAHHRLVLIDGGGGVGTLVRVDPDVIKVRSKLTVRTGVSWQGIQETRPSGPRRYEPVAPCTPPSIKGILHACRMR